MSDCIFCKIINNEIPSIKIREDENFIALLDVFPNIKWQALVMPKKHYDSDISEVEPQIAQDIITATQKVIKLLKKWLGVKRVGIVVEWLQVNHLHIRLYPFYKDYGFENGIEAWEKANFQELKELADKITEKDWF